MKRIRTEPHDHGAEGDERIRTAVPAPSDDPVYEHRGYLYNAGPISFRASGLDEAWRIVQALDALLKAELGDRAQGAVSLGFPRADDSNFAPPKRGGAS